jgi:hypothetical protein
MAFRQDIELTDLTDEDRAIWSRLIGQGGRLHRLVSVWQQAHLSDVRDGGVMLWIESQAGYVNRRNRQRRRRVSWCKARVGMWI